MKPKFSLKDQLFNLKKVEYVARLIANAYPNFKEEEFTKRVVGNFPQLELKKRIYWIRENLKKYLPNDYKKAVAILLRSLPKECDPKKIDNDFGDFIFSPFSDFVATYGCQKEYLDFSLCALGEMTKRFSAEDAIRYFLNAFPLETLEKMQEWSRDSHYHVRRLASEGTRPKLPWCQKVNLNSEEVISKILGNLYYDKTRYVVRSVANHLNDISKDSPHIAISAIESWQKAEKQHSKEMSYLTSHAFRTLIKMGNKEALKVLGYDDSPKIRVKNFTLLSPEVHLNESADFSFNIYAEKNESLIIDYIMYFQGKKGDLLPKVFKIKKCTIAKGETLTLYKKHPLREMTTKKLYSGKHKIVLQINGKPFGEEIFLFKK